MSDEVKVPKIYAAMHAIMADFGVVEKSNTNSFQKYQFRSVGQGMARLQPLLVKHRVIAIPHYPPAELIAQEKGYTAKVLLQHQFIHIDDGTDVMVSMPGQGADSGDKAVYKAIAGALKYAIFQTFMVPEEGNDAENESPVVVPSSAVASKKPLSVKDILG